MKLEKMRRNSNGGVFMAAENGYHGSAKSGSAGSAWRGVINAGYLKARKLSVAKSEMAKASVMAKIMWHQLEMA
jgi:hypothetical protein